MWKAHAFQLDLVWEDRAANLANAGRRIAAAAPEPASLLILPEMFDVGYTMNSGVALAGDTHAFLKQIATRFASYVIAGHAGISVDQLPANQAVVYGPNGKVVAAYSKVHLFTPANEHLAYFPGRGPVVFDFHGLRVAPLVCYDLRFPELFRAALDLGAEAFVVIANWPAARIAHWSILARARAIENLAYVVAVNRCGRDPNHAYPGASVIVGPRGEVLAEAGVDETTLVATLDPAAVRDWRREYPALRDRDPSKAPG